MNKYAPHVYVIPEDDANRQMADGFLLHPSVNDTRIQVMPAARGWPNVLQIFQDEYVPKLRDYPHAHVVMVVDFDNQVEKRRLDFERVIPAESKARVFVVGSRDTPETLKKEFKQSFEKIGTALADDCDRDTATFWGHEQLVHNELERKRLIETVMAFAMGHN